MAAISRDNGTTVIGPSIVISGKISGEEDLTIRGRVEGSLQVAGALVVDPGGVVKADVTAKSAVVSGVLVGNVTAEQSVELTREARMVGDIQAPRVIILDGAAYRGRVDMSGAPAPVARTSQSPAARSPARVTQAPAARPAPPSRPVPPPAPRTSVAAPSAAPVARSSVQRAEGRPVPPPAPPAAPVVAAASRKKVVVRKRK
jgi:cytoskeletal protein CcmA (bactofilin family)